MRKFLFSLMMCFLAITSMVQAKTVVLDGSQLTLEQAWLVAQGQAQVEIAPKAMDELGKAHQLVMAAARAGVPVYGLTVGVGLNKDKSLFNANGELSQEVLDASREFNYNALRAHSAGVGPMMKPELVRLSMVIRLNTLLTGQSGAQPEVAKLYQAFLNQNVIPVIPSRGSMGEADITLASHVGAVMVGEWKVLVDGKEVPAAQVLKQKGIKPLVPEGKDALAILSNNSVAMAYAVEAAIKTEQLLRVSPTVFALSLEGLNGNVAPVLPQSIQVRPFPELEKTAAQIRQALDGSYLWQLNEKRPLQDPLSFRTTVYTLAEAWRALDDLKAQLLIQINSSDDNPATILNASADYSQSPQVERYFIKNDDVAGAIIPTANFEPLPVTLALQRTTLALAHVSHNSVQRTLHLSDDHFTGLSRFLSAPGNPGHAFGAIQKPFVSLHAENIDLANPVSLHGVPVAGNIEDTLTNTPQAAMRLTQVVENLNTIYALELLHSSQAIDLRLMEDKGLALGKQSKKLYQAYRQIVPFVDKDRIFTDDIANSTQLLKTYTP